MNRIILLFSILLSFEVLARTKILPCSNESTEALAGFHTKTTFSLDKSFKGIVLNRRKPIPKVHITARIRKETIETKIQFGLDSKEFSQPIDKNASGYIWEVKYDNFKLFSKVYSKENGPKAEWDLTYLFSKNPNICGVSIEDNIDQDSFKLSDVIQGKIGDTLTRGVFFSPTPFIAKDWIQPSLESFKQNLPNPIWEGEQGLLDMYWFTWKLALGHFRTPTDHPGTVAPYLDENFSDNFFQWDTAFMLQFGKYLIPRYNPITSFDNFYNLQHHTGKIWKEYSEINGDELWDLIKGDREINPPLFAWAEWETFKISGDKARLGRIFKANEEYLSWLEAGRKASGTSHRLYWNSPLGCGMDNIPVPFSHQHGWVDMSAQMVLAYNSMAKIASVLGLSDKESQYREMANEIGKRINDYMWDDKQGIYFDIDSFGRKIGVKHIGLFWPIIAGITSPEQERRLLEHLKNPNEFNTDIPFATLSKDSPKFRSTGHYWRGGVWAPTNYMVIKGLEDKGYEKEANEFSNKYLMAMLEVFRYTNTVWELYAPLKNPIKLARDFSAIDESKFGPMVFTPGKTVAGFGNARADFVGWTGVGPINLFLENLIGIKRNVMLNKIDWTLGPLHRHGIENLPFGEGFISLVCDKREKEEEFNISVDTTKMDKAVILNLELGGKIKMITLPPGRKFNLRS